MARVSQFMMQKLLQALLSRENLGKVLYLEHYMKFYLDIEMCQTILLQTLPTDWPLFALKSTTLVQTTSWCFLITCYVVLEILLSARLENWRHGRWGLLRKTIDIQIESVHKLIYSCFVLQNFCERNSRCGIDEEEVQAQTLLHSNDDKTTPNTFWWSLLT